MSSNYYGSIAGEQADERADIPRGKLQDLIDAIHRNGRLGLGWRDTENVAELLTQFLDAEGFNLTPPRLTDSFTAAENETLARAAVKLWAGHDLEWCSGLALAALTSDERAILDRAVTLLPPEPEEDPAPVRRPLRDDEFEASTAGNGWGPGGEDDGMMGPVL